MNIEINDDDYKKFIKYKTRQTNNKKMRVIKKSILTKLSLLYDSNDLNTILTNVNKINVDVNDDKIDDVKTKK